MAGDAIRVPTTMILSTTIRVAAKVIHMRFQLCFHIGEVCDQAFQFTIRSLSKQLHKGAKSTQKAVKELLQTGWVALKQDNRVSPITPTLLGPIREFFKRMWKSAMRRINRAKFRGQAIALEILFFLIASRDFVDDGAVGLLPNPSTDANLGVDRLYICARVAFEVNGRQHYEATDLYDQDTVDAQRARDAIKKELCAENDIELVIIRLEDLSVGTILQKLPGLRHQLPLRTLVGAESFIEYMDDCCARYRRNCPALACG